MESIPFKLLLIQIKDRVKHYVYDPELTYDIEYLSTLTQDRKYIDELMDLYHKVLKIQSNNETGRFINNSISGSSDSICNDQEEAEQIAAAGLCALWDVEH